MRDFRPFMPMGKTILVASAATAPAGVQAPPTDTNALEACQFRVHNSSNSVTTFYAYGDTNTGAANNAVAANASTSQHSYPLPPGGIEVITAPRNTYWSSYSASNVSVYITPGAGV